MRTAVLVLSGLLSFLVGCGPAATGNPSVAPPTAKTSTEPGVTSIPTQQTPGSSRFPIDDPQLAATIPQALDDLAARLGRDPADIEVVSAEPVTWPDGSLGCPQPGMMYTQALVDGSRVILGIDGRTRVFAYHAGSDGVPFLCPSGERDGGHEFVPPPGFDI